MEHGGYQSPVVGQEWFRKVDACVSLKPMRP